MRLYDHYKHNDPWDQNLSSDLIPAIKHLRKIFAEHHWTYGQITEKLCYYRLHPGEAGDIEEHLAPLQQLKGIVGLPATQNFIDFLKTDTPPAIFKAFIDLYLGGMTVSALTIFFQFVAVGKAHESQLGVPHLEWAEAQTRNMIRSNIHLIEIWIRNVCDKQPYDANEDFEERIFWRKWQAPMLTVMKPSRYAPYDPARNWERFDAEESREILEGLAEHYVLHIESRLEKLAGQAALQLAKQPKPIQQKAADNNSAPTDRILARSARAPVSVRREANKLQTQTRHKNWQNAYRSLKKSRPDTPKYMLLKLNRVRRHASGGSDGSHCGAHKVSH